MDVENISQILDELAVRFGATGAHLWEELVRYHVTMAVAESAVCVVTAGVCIAALGYCKRKSDCWEFGGDGFAAAACLLGIGAFIFVVVSVATFPHALGAIVAPEAATLKSLTGGG